jgi:hypothetical protein
MQMTLELSQASRRILVSYAPLATADLHLFRLEQS